jgi:gamma-glutamylcyclotransferase (GGCT)/AIG2-like uncharacterized protein YtfP
MPLVFSYGSLQEEAVQRSIYGHVLRGEPDELLHCRRERIVVPPWHKAAAAGVTHYQNVIFEPGSDGRVKGTALELTEAELIASDEYEREANYVRVPATLASGRPVWVYVNAESVRTIDT